MKERALVKKVALPMPLLARAKPTVDHHTKVARHRPIKKSPDLVTTRGTARIYRLWTATECQEIVSLHESGKTWEEIATMYDVTKSAVRGAAHKCGAK